MSATPEPKPVMPPERPFVPGFVEDLGPNGSLFIYLDSKPYAGAGRGGLTGWSWWAASTQGRRVAAASREEAYAAARAA